LTHFRCSLAPDAQDLLPSRSHGDLLKHLPVALTHLCLGQLSAKGVRELVSALPRLSSLRVVDLHDCALIDDPVCVALGKLPSLTHLCIRQMSGSKVTDDGIAALLGAFNLEVLELIDFEGRLTKRCWAKIDVQNISPALRVIHVALNEAPTAQHSWCADHLQSISALLALPPLRVFSVRRIPHPQIYSTPRQNHPALPIAEPIVPKRLPRDIAMALINPDCPRLDELGLDFFEISLDQLQVLADSFRSSLQALHVFVDDTIARIVNPSPEALRLL
jgi:hypothetical protein